MICKYCTNAVTPDSRLAHLDVCAECATMDEEGNRMQVEMGKGYFDTKRNIVSLSDCQTMVVASPHSVQTNQMIGYARSAGR